MSQGLTIWISGLPGAGKSLLAQNLEERLLERGLNAERLDADEILSQWLPGLSYEVKEWEGLIRLLGHISTLLTRNGVIAIVAALTPHEDLSNELRGQIGRFVEVSLICPPEICKGRASGGRFEAVCKHLFEATEVRLDSFRGSSSAEVVLETDKESPENCCERVLRTIEMLGYIPESKQHDYTSEDEAKISKRLKDLGYL